MSIIEDRLSMLLEQANVRLIETPKLGVTFNAVYHAESRTIFVRWGIDPVTRRCAIAHELGHAIYGDTESSPLTERRADKWAATNLITLDDVNVAAENNDGVLSAMAADIGVTPHMLELWFELHQAGSIPHQHSCLKY
ncbi:hypothetical protein HMPREF2657_09265 [Corynebacterium sp. HMSC072B08]|uniref:ImmA/IrrE family metallo-endopeptidase n=1 Tax=Corynebacterium sp. HMSC072B08 TaxID=1715136 RepID=UPI0008A9139B|nr:ImmA/IrrE family metallo-endopeptidase [Corynebacterium sp. HMSC072B08]OHQ65218.1 hypothetical protein HMPREF2657_09265 [Corynebacterium sp. HMSC072B08]